MQYNSDELGEILNIFKAESEEIIESMNDAFLALEKNPSDKTPLKKLLQLVHSLKGSSKMLGFNNIQDIAHKLEDILSLWKKDDVVINCDFQIIYETCDFLNGLVVSASNKNTDTANSNVMNIINKLDNFLNENLYSKPEKKENKTNIIIEKNTDINAIILELMFILENDEELKDAPEEIIEVLTENLSHLQEIFEATQYNSLKGQISQLLNFLNNNSEQKGKILFDCKKEFLKLINTIYSLFQSLNINIRLKSEKVPEKQKENKEISNVIQNNNLLEKYDNILKNLGRIKYEKDYIKTVKSGLEEIISQTNDDKITLILSKSVNILNILTEKNSVTDNNCYLVILQCIYLAKRLTAKEEEEDLNNINFIMQRLNVVEDMYTTLTPRKETAIIKAKEEIIDTNSFQGLQNKLNTIDLQEIKTLRVDTSKLDTLIAQTGELLINGIKTKEHINELTKINNKIQQWNSASKKIVNYLRYLEKKGFFNSEFDENGVSFYKKIQGFFNNNSETIGEVQSDLNNLYKIVTEDDNKLHQTVMEIESIAKGIRVLPLATIFHSFPRMMRDITAENNKKIDFIVTGSDTTVDKKIIEEIKIPLIHILRNAVSHGIEPVKERIKNSKPETGIVRLTAKQVENTVVITIEDDGYGINIEKVKQTALNKGILTNEEINNMDNEQIMKLLFLPGFSTEDSVSELSGRGIGLDVVKTKINNLNGEIFVDSILNKGCKVTIKLPLSMSTIETFVFLINNNKYAIPVNSIKFVKRINSDEIRKKSGQNTIIFDEHTIPIFLMSEMLNEESIQPKENEQLTTIIIENQDRQAAYIVDKLLGDQEVFHKKLVAPIIKVKNISGFTTLATGEICLIINPYELIRNSVINNNFIDLEDTKFLTDGDT